MSTDCERTRRRPANGPGGVAKRSATRPHQAGRDRCRVAKRHVADTARTRSRDHIAATVPSGRTSPAGSVARAYRRAATSPIHAPARRRARRGPRPRRTTRGSTASPRRRAKAAPRRRARGHAARARTRLARLLAADEKHGGHRSEEDQHRRAKRATWPCAAGVSSTRRGSTELTAGRRGPRPAPGRSASARVTARDTLADTSPGALARATAPPTAFA